MQKTEPGRGRLFAVGTVLVMLACALFFAVFDRPVITYFQALDPGLSQVFESVTLAGDALYPLALAATVFLFCAWRLRHNPHTAAIEQFQRWKVRAIFIFFAVAGSGLLTDLFKFLCGRPRPQRWLTENLYGFYLFGTSANMQSFPSGHSNTAVALALALWYLWPKSWPLGVALAASVILSRVALLRHYPSDTLFGAWLAVVTTFYLYRYFRGKYPAAFPQKSG